MIEILSRFRIKKNVQIYIKDLHKLIKVNNRSTLTNNQLENYFGGNFLAYEITDEFSEYSEE